MRLRAYLHVLAVGGALIGSALGSGLALGQQNQAPLSPRMQALVREYIEVTNMAKMMDDMIGAMVPAMMNQLLQRNSQIPEDVRQQMSEALIAEFRASQGEAIEQMGAVVGRSLQEEDLTAAIAFYRTPSGQRLLAAAPRMAPELLAIGQRWGQAAGQRAMQRAIGKARERGIQL